MKIRMFRKKAIALAVMFCVLLGSIPALALDGLIYKTETQKTLALGVTLTQTKLFTQSGWQNVSTVRANLRENPYIKAVPLFNKSGASLGQSVLNMAKDYDTLAAINADFFDSVPGGGVSPIGTLVQDGEVVSTPAHDSGFATFYTDINGKPFFDYFTYSVKVTSPSGVSAPVKHINKYNFNGDIVYLDQNWKGQSIGSQNGRYELVVQNDVVVEKRENLPPVAIPENGYVLNCTLAFSTFLRDYFSVGEKVVVEKYLTPDLSKIQTAVGTGSQILKDGQKTTITFDVAGINPRSAVGFDKEDNLYLLTVDGRQGEQALGMTTQQVADFMLEMGITDAAILDGGGSTNLAAKDFQSGQQEIVNQPSQNGRLVASGIGITSTAPVSELAGLVVFDDGEKMFQSGSKAFSVVGYDQYFNRIEVDQGQVSYSVSGVEGSFSGLTFTAATAGTAVITASYNGVSGSKEVTVLGDPVYLSIPSSSVSMSAGQTIDFPIEARDENGFSAPLPLYMLNVSSQNGLVQFNNHTLTALGGGEDLIRFTYKGLSVSAQVTVSGEALSAALTDDFESDNGRFTGYPSYVAGSYERSSEQKHGGNSSGKLSFDFNDANDDLRAAYLEFTEPKALPSGTQKVGVWMYSDQDYGHMLRGMIYDSAGQAVRIAFTDSISAGGWQYFEATVPADLSYPARLSRLYVVQADKNVKNAGHIYLDDLKIFAAGQSEDVEGGPVSLVYTDPMNQKVEKQEGDFRFSVYGNVQPSNTLLQLMTNRYLASKINASCDSAMFLGPIDMNRLSNVKTEIRTTYGYYNAVYGDVTFLVLDNSVDGLRKTSSEQWSFFLNALDQVSTQNVMVFLPRKPDASSFSDPLELNLFFEVLTEKLYKTGKTAVVAYPDEYINAEMKDGVHYLSVPNMPDVRAWNVVSQLPVLKYFEFTVSGGTLTYEIKSIF